MKKIYIDTGKNAFLLIIGFIIILTDIIYFHNPLNFVNLQNQMTKIILQKTVF